VWVDSVTLITSQHLLAKDSDTACGDIIFTVSSPTNGHLAYLNNTFSKIYEFSQQDIDAEKVTFVHKGQLFFVVVGVIVVVCVCVCVRVCVCVCVCCFMLFFKGGFVKYV
jgi:hypothetical protein